LITVKIPATSANIGSGFDSLGLALTLYNELHIKETECSTICSLDNTPIPTDDSNLVLMTMKFLFDLCGKKFPEVSIGQINGIPLSRGLGSSSACVVGGLLGANQMMGNILTRQELIDLAASLEGHPDNTTPAFMGGFVAAVFDGKHVHYVRQQLHTDLKFAALIPNFELKTSLARSVLPKTITHKDAVFNLSRAALMSASLTTGTYHNLRVAADDRLHQNYRIALIEGAPGAIRILDEQGAYCTYVSGAGSTLMSICSSCDTQFFQRARKQLDKEGYGAWDLIMLDADNTGALCAESRNFEVWEEN
jgi:homoserine kinase